VIKVVRAAKSQATADQPRPYAVFDPFRSRRRASADVNSTPNGPETTVTTLDFPHDLIDRRAGVQPGSRISRGWTDRVVPRRYP
jgi:hypothetical protein